MSLNIIHRTFSQGKAHYYMFPCHKYYPWAENRSNKYIEMFYNAEWKKYLTVWTDLNTSESSNSDALKLHSSINLQLLLG